MHRSAVMIAGWLIAGWIAIEPATAQQSTIGSNFNRSGSSFSERIGVGFGFRIPGSNMHFRQGAANPGPAPPGGFSLRGGGPNGFFNITGSQSSQRGSSFQSSSVTVSNGGRGFFSDSTNRPFVVGVVPVVGGFVDLPQQAGLPRYGMVSPIQQRLTRMEYEKAASSQPGQSIQIPARPDPPPAAPAGDPISQKVNQARASTAGQAVASVASIRAQQQAVDNSAEQELQEAIRKARIAETDGKLGVARIYYQKALRRATGSLREQLAKHLRQLAPR